jgi:predicted outer membrane repeat protein
MAGTVAGVDYTQYRVAAFIYVPGLGFFTKPYYALPTVAINSDGTWTVDVSTGGAGSLDPKATIFAAWLVPSAYNPPIAASSPRMPAALDAFPHAITERYGRTVDFAGQTWAAKDTHLPAGPGSNRFSSLPTDLWVDAAGLHLTIHDHDGSWWTTEVTRLGNPLGYGTYWYQTNCNTGNLDLNVTFGGGFLFDDYGDEEGADGSHSREVDMGEDSRWGVATDPNTQNVKQPYDYPAANGANRHRFNLPDLSSNPALTRIMIWKANSLHFITLKGHYSPANYPPSAVVDDYFYAHDPAAGRYVPLPGRERVHFNLWLNKLVDSTQPSNGQPVEVIINNFGFTPLPTANTRTVINLNDSGAGSLRQAIADAADGDTIDFAVTGTIPLIGELTVGKNLMIEGPGTSNLTVSGGDASRVFNITGGVVSISGLTIANGRIASANGGGIFNAGTLSVSKCAITNNHVNATFITDRWVGSGGGIYNSGGTLTVSDSTISGNGVDFDNGGGIYSNGILTVSDCIIANNEAIYGGGILSTGSKLTVTNGLFSNNVAHANGGGISNFGTAGSNLTVTGATFSGNSAHDFGGGLYNYAQGGTAAILRCALSMNSANNGGGIWNEFEPLTVDSTTFFGNSATSLGGAISNKYSVITIRNSTFSGNAATSGYGGGGAIDNGGVYTTAGTVSLINCTLSGNSGGRGGGVFNTNVGLVNIHNTIIAGNTASTSGPDLSGAITSEDYNLIQDTNGCTITGSTAHNITGMAANLGPLQDNDGPTFTRALLSGSPAIDAGDNSVLGPPVSLVTDQRGFNRKAGSAVDIGAFEFGSTMSTPPLRDWNGDGNADLVWQNTVSGSRAIWFMNGATFVSVASLGIISTDWQIAGTGDFNGDGKPDIVWQNTNNGGRGIWFMNGATYLGSAGLGAVSTDWQIVGTGDFNGDGQTDIVWQNTVNGGRGIWFMNGATYAGSAGLGVVSTDWQIAGTGDFNGDGQTDIVWQNTVNGGRGIWFMNGATYAGSAGLGAVSTDWQIAGTGDFNGDGKPDLVWQNTINGGRGFWFMNGATYAGSAGLGAVVTDWKIIGN